MTTPTSHPVTARAHANIALVKYWGKRDAADNLPAAGSLSLTLDALTTITTVRFDAALADDAMELDGAPASAAVLAKTSRWLDLVRAQAAISTRAAITTRNHFPTASGLASSASGFAALALAASRAAGLALAPRDLSILARQGSGSAARSIYGGFARMHAGDTSDAAYATAIDGDAFAARVRMVIAVVGGGAPKLHLSRDAMEHCAKTSPLYAGWLACVPGDLRAAEDAIARADLPALGEITEANALAMHAAAIASRPAIIYWQPTTLALCAEVRALRERGVPAWATMDAGPHVKVLTEAASADVVAGALRAIPGVSAVSISASGGPAVIE
ncbi:MAG: diphosphomevalonate decarboxylase [Deltaproteobacteria bacterium]|nr:diphosphomevalonate decarboxylase [Deltaproteobacteria bacterium]